MTHTLKERIAQTSLTDGEALAVYAQAIMRLERDRAELIEALTQAVAYTTRKEAHKGCMNKEQLAKAERDFVDNITAIATGRYLGDMVNFDLANARALLKRMKEQS